MALSFQKERLFASIQFSILPVPALSPMLQGPELGRVPGSRPDTAAQAVILVPKSVFIFAILHWDCLCNCCSCNCSSMGPIPIGSFSLQQTPLLLHLLLEGLPLRRRTTGRPAPPALAARCQLPPRRLVLHLRWRTAPQHAAAPAARGRPSLSAASNRHQIRLDLLQHWLWRLVKAGEHQRL